MAKTLADMTAEEHEGCVGMWASHQGHKDKDEPCGNLGVISEIDRDYAWVAFPKESAETYVFDFEDIIPRHDLPRVWTSDGEPVEMVKEYGIFYTLRDGGEEICFVHDDPLSVEPAVKHLEKSLRRGTITKITRKTQWVTEWEEMPEPQRTNGMVNPYV